MEVEALSPFRPSLPKIRIRLARTEGQIQQAVGVRYQAYAERLSGLASDVAIKEDLDRTVDPVILLAENALTAEVVGTARLNSGPGVRDLLAQIDLPAHYHGERLGYFSRMAAIGDPTTKRIVRGLLHKSLLKVCVAKQVDRMLLLVGDVRSKLYAPWGFKPVFSKTLLTPAMLHGRSVNLYELETRKAEEMAKELGQPLYKFLFQTYHEEIEIFNSLSSVPSRSVPSDPLENLRAIEAIESHSGNGMTAQTALSLL